MFGAQPSSSPFGTPSSTPAFGTPSSTPAFGTPSSTPAFGTPSSTPAFGTPSSTPAFGTPSSTPAFGTSLFSSPFSQQAQPQQQTPSLFQTPQTQQQQSPFGFSSPFNVASQTQPSPFNAPPATNFMNSQLTTQMAPVAPPPFSLADREIKAIVDAYKEEAGNPNFAFKHLLFSVTEPQYRIKPTGVPDIMWAEAIAKLEGMESSKRERLWPQLVNGFKDLSNRLKLQDEVIHSDSERLQMTRGNIKTLLRHFLVDILPWIQRMQQKQQSLQRRILRAMRTEEALESKGSRLPLMKGEVELAEKLAAIKREIKGSEAALARRVENLLTLSRLQVESLTGGSIYLPGSTKIHAQSLADMQEVLHRQTEAIARMDNVLKRGMRNMEIIMSEDTDMAEA